MPAPFSGGCRCGAIRYTCSAEPVMVANCHCRDCQYASGGGASTVALVPRPAIEIEVGEVSRFSVVAENGKQVTRQFCGVCGSPLFSELESMPQLFVVKAGSLDDPSWLVPGAHIWTRSAQPWSLADDGLPRFETNPG